MAENKNSRDEKLIRELYEKLNWFTYEATDEEFDPDEVNAILDLLDKLDPLPDSPVPFRKGKGQSGAGDSCSDGEEGTDSVPVSDAEAAFERFKKKYNITEEDLARKNSGSAAETNAEGKNIIPFPAEFSEELAFDPVQAREAVKRSGRGAEVRMDAALETGTLTKKAAETAQGENGAGFKKAKKTWFGRLVSTGWGKAAVAFVVVIVVFTLTTVGTSAVKQKSFFEIVKSGVNSMRITVTGNEMESESVSMAMDKGDKVYYDSWEEVKEEVPGIMIPEYIPEGVKLEEIYRTEMENYNLYKGLYVDGSSNELLISVKDFSNNYADLEQIVDKEWKLIDENEKVKYYQVENLYKALWEEGRCIYIVEWSDLGQIDEIIMQMK